MNDTPTLTASPESKQRINMWRDTVEEQSRVLLKEAASVRESINTAKTATKRKFYTKRFKKITSELLKLLFTIEQLNKTIDEANKPALAQDPSVASA